MAPVVRGLLLAVPVVGVLGALLASADVFFSDFLSNVLYFLDFDNLLEYGFRAFYIVIISYFLAAGYLFALNRSRKEELLGLKKPWVKPFLGFTEAAIVLSSVVVLFATFVILQIRYFFGGASNVVSNSAGFTYAEYARQGFAELVAVAILSLFLFMVLSSIAKRGEVRQQGWFSGLGIALMLLVSVILVSAFQRLLLYESVYGFTQMRTYPHVFMIWLGLLLAAVVILELTHRRRAFALAFVLAAIGFAATLPILNVDAFIVRANLERLNRTGNIDIGYLARLSEDALPPLASEYERALASGDEERMQILAGTLLCHASQHGYYATGPNWQSFHFSRTAAAQTWAPISDDAVFSQMASFGERNNRYIHSVVVNGEEMSCFPESWD
jgi:hypothetical protein